MSEYKAVVEWERRGAVFTDHRYSREHRWTFDEGMSVPASASPHIVPLPYSTAAAVDPEEAFVAALASCHMLFFLSLAAKQRFTVESYRDTATGMMGKDGEGKEAMLEVTFRPEVRFGGDRLPTAADIDALHHAAHEECFLARSVKTTVRCEPAPALR
ncbi:MAG TPA: OsmC family protein [Gemmatimonadales bacterium]|nr:OsmC family protein [Gemmatimonadales bacterium]